MFYFIRNLKLYVVEVIMRYKDLLGLSKFKAKELSILGLFKPKDPGILIDGCLYGEENSTKLAKLCAKHKVDLVPKKPQENVFRGVCVEHYLGSKTRPGLGLTAMRPGLARFLQANNTDVFRLDDSDREDFTRSHVVGYSSGGGNTKDKANSFTRSPYVGICFGVDASRSTKYPSVTLLSATPIHPNLMHWPVIYDGNIEQFSDQCETLIPFDCLPLEHIVLIKREKDYFLNLNDLQNANTYTSSVFHEHSKIISSTDFTRYVQIYQELEIKKVIAFDDYVRYISLDSPDTIKADSLFQIYKQTREEQAKLLPFCSDEKERWIAIAREIAPTSYNALEADEEGFTIILPGQDGSKLVKKVSNIDATLQFAPLFEASPNLTLEKIKNGEILEAGNYLVESVVRENKALVDFSELNRAIEDNKPLLNKM